MAGNFNGVRAFGMGDHVAVDEVGLAGLNSYDDGEPVRRPVDKVLVRVIRPASLAVASECDPCLGPNIQLETWVPGTIAGSNGERSWSIAK